MKKIFALIFLSLLAEPSLAAETFKCSRQTPARFQLEKPSVCDDRVIWRYDMEEMAKKDHALFEKEVESNARLTSNMGGAKFTFPSGVEKKVFRSSFMAGKKECLAHLIKKEEVHTMMNYYQGSLKSGEPLSSEEKDLFSELGGKLYVRSLNYQYDFKKMPKEKIMDKVAEIIRTIEYAPGNVLIHCYGGIHRTGVVFGVMQKCLNKIPVEDVLNEYKCHVAWEDETKPGGYEIDNEVVIREFPCERLNASSPEKRE